MPSPADTDNLLHMLLAEAKRVERSARVMKQLAARAIDAEAAATSDSQEAHAHDEDRRTD